MPLTLTDPNYNEFQKIDSWEKHANFGYFNKNFPFLLVGWAASAPPTIKDSSKLELV